MQQGCQNIKPLSTRRQTILNIIEQYDIKTKVNCRIHHQGQSVILNLHDHDFLNAVIDFSTKYLWVENINFLLNCHQHFKLSNTTEKKLSCIKIYNNFICEFSKSSLNISSDTRDKLTKKTEHIIYAYKPEKLTKSLQEFNVFLRAAIKEIIALVDNRLEYSSHFKKSLEYHQLKKLAFPNSNNSLSNTLSLQNHASAPYQMPIEITSCPHVENTDPEINPEHIKPIISQPSFRKLSLRSQISEPFPVKKTYKRYSTRKPSIIDLKVVELKIDTTISPSPTINKQPTTPEKSSNVSTIAKNATPACMTFLLNIFCKCCSNKPKVKQLQTLQELSSPSTVSLSSINML